MLKRFAGDPGRDTPAEERMETLLQRQEPLPPYERDPSVDSPAVRKRVGDVIAKAMDRRIPKR